MQDPEKVIGISDYKGTPLLAKHVVNGAFIKRSYIKCPYLEKRCKWLLDNNNGAYSYLNNACYLSGSFNLECP